MTIQDAERYIDKHRVPKEAKPVFHLTTPVGWLNDPNGFSVYDDKIHLFYQFHPYSGEWGPMHWGHYQSSDFIKWEELPTALAPDMEYDAAGCFSGTALEVDGKHVLFYTGVKEKENEDGRKEIFQNQCMAIGDGRKYVKCLDNPVVDGRIMPKECSRTDFRDPKVWKDHDGLFYMLAGNQTYGNEPQVVLFSSKDLKAWEFVSVFAKDETKRFGTIWECPDYFRLNGRDILVVSPQHMQADDEFHNGHNVACFLGDVDNDEKQFRQKTVFSLDYGFDFYAPQTMETKDGRRVMIGWMQSWDTTIAIPGKNKWAGMMTVPRELELKEDRIFQNPVRELETYRVNEKVINASLLGSCELEGISGRILDMTVEIEGGDYSSLCIKLAKDDRHETSFTYRVDDRMLVCDRTFAGWNRDINCVRKMCIKNKEGLKKLRFIMDKNSIELFVNDGEQVFTAVIYTPMSAKQIVFECVGKADIKVAKYDLCFD